MPNRRRNKSVTLRLTEEEYLYFMSRLNMTKSKNQTDFILSVLNKKPIVVINELRPVLVELKRQGNNLNQIARQLKSSPFDEAAKSVLNECWKAYRILSVYAGGELHAAVQGAGVQEQTQ